MIESLFFFYLKFLIAKKHFFISSFHISKKESKSFRQIILKIIIKFRLQRKNEYHYLCCFSYSELFQTAPKLFGNRPYLSIVLQFGQVLLRLGDAPRFCRFFFVFLLLFQLIKKGIRLFFRVGKFFKKSLHDIGNNRED